MVVLANMDATSHEKPSLASNLRKKRLSCHIYDSQFSSVSQPLEVQHSKLSTHFKIKNPSTLQILITHTCPNNTLQKNNFLIPNKVMLSNKCGKPYSTNITFQLTKKWKHNFTNPKNQVQIFASKYTNPDAILTSKSTLQQTTQTNQNTTLYEHWTSCDKKKL
jgi:hypothetical protein